MWLLLLLGVAGFAVAVDQEFDPELQKKYETIPRHEFIEYFNGQNYSWKMAHYDHLEGKRHSCAEIGGIDDFPVKTHDPATFDDLPENFDARTAWPHCETIRKIFYQDVCGNCWAFGSTTMLQDRTCIHTDITVYLSVADLQCCHYCYGKNVCAGGNGNSAIKFWVRTGLVTEQCKPFNEKELMRTGTTCNRTCHDPSIDYERDKHRGKEYYVVSKKHIENEIKAELVKNGPIHTTFLVCDDFGHYKSGIYVHTHGKCQDWHDVRVIGYGKENGVSYWLAANSWGTDWGDKGFFKIKSYQRLFFEKNMRAGKP